MNLLLKRPDLNGRPEIAEVGALLDSAAQANKLDDVESAKTERTFKSFFEKHSCRELGGCLFGEQNANTARGPVLPIVKITDQVTSEIEVRRNRLVGSRLPETPIFVDLESGNICPRPVRTGAGLEVCACDDATLSG